MRDCVICSHCSHLQSVCLWQRGYREVLSMRESCTGDSQYYSVCHAGADIPESRRIFLRKHNVHRKSAEWDGSVFTVSQGKKTGTDQTGTLLFWNHFILCGWCGNRRKSVCEVRVSCDLDIRWTSVDQFSADVLRKD